jgi:hypothetical protein
VPVMVPTVPVSQNRKKRHTLQNHYLQRNYENKGFYPQKGAQTKTTSDPRA